MTSTWSHFSRGQSGQVGVSPALLDCLAVCPPNTLCIIKRIIRLAGFTVGREVEFRNKIGELEVLNIKIGVVLRDLFEVMNCKLSYCLSRGTI